MTLENSIDMQLKGTDYCDEINSIHTHTNGKKINEI